MKRERLFLLVLGLMALVLIPADLFYASRFVPRFKEIERQRIVVSNQLATAKIVSENLDHVRDLVFRNMQFPGQKDSVSQETVLFDFLTSCMNDLKMRLVSVRPSRPSQKDRVTTRSYQIEIEGDFFSLGELCAKLENSQRVLSITSLEVVQTGGEGSKEAQAKAPPTVAGRRGVLIKMNLDTYRVKKS